MMQIPNLPEKQEFEYKEKQFLQKFYDDYQRSNKKWFYAFLAAAILAIPAGLVLQIFLARQFISSYQPPVVAENIYSDAKEILVAREGLLQAGDNLYSAYAQILNQNPEFSARHFRYEFVFRNRGGEVIGQVAGTDYLFPGESKIITEPAIALDTEPTRIDFEISDPLWSRSRPDPVLDLVIISRGSGFTEEGNFFVEGVLRNNQGVTLEYVDVSAVVFETGNENIAAVNKTVLDDLEPFEDRYFRLVWPRDHVFLQPGGSLGLIDIRPQVNTLIPGAVKR